MLTLLKLLRWGLLLLSIFLAVLFIGVIFEKIINPGRTSGSIISNVLVFGAFSLFLFVNAYAFYVVLFKNKKNFSELNLKTAQLIKILYLCFACLVPFSFLSPDFSSDDIPRTIGIGCFTFISWFALVAKGNKEVER